jgi:tRNA-splicing ligase RtcB
MPDVHWGYGFPIGGVAAMRLEGGIISPGGVGFDINCGVRLIKTEIELKDISTRLENIVDNLFNNIPSGLGCCSQIRLNPVELDRVLEKGATWAIEQGYGRDLDIELTEEKGTMIDAATDSVSKRAKERGASQLGTLGSGNHFVELAVVDEIYDPVAAYAMGITRTGQVMCWIHTGSRGLGHQIADDYIKVMLNAMPGYGISVPDRQLACSPVNSPEGLDYLAAMRCAANYAWANRQIITHWARQTICQTLEIGMQSAGMDLVCDVAHNIAKIENHIVNKHTEQLCVHRKGATRAFGANHPDLPKRYKKIGQPVLIPGDMGRYSYIMTGSQTALEETFGSTCMVQQLKSRMALKKS